MRCPSQVQGEPLSRNRARLVSASSCLFSGGARPNLAKPSAFGWSRRKGTRAQRAPRQQPQQAGKSAPRAGPFFPQPRHFAAAWAFVELAPDSRGSELVCSRILMRCGVPFRPGGADQVESPPHQQMPGSLPHPLV